MAFSINVSVFPCNALFFEIRRIVLRPRLCSAESPTFCCSRRRPSPIRRPGADDLLRGSESGRKPKRTARRMEMARPSRREADPRCERRSRHSAVGWIEWNSSFRARRFRIAEPGGICQRNPRGRGLVRRDGPFRSAADTGGTDTTRKPAARFERPRRSGSESHVGSSHGLAASTRPRSTRRSGIS